MILFSQSAADIQYILYLYDKHKENKNIKIYVVNVENNYKFLKSLNLKAKLEFIPTKSLKKLSTYFSYILKLKNRYKKNFFNIKNEDIYFFSINYDYVTSFFIERLYQKNQVYFVDVYKQKFTKKLSTQNNVKKAIIHYLLGIKVYFDEYSYIYILNKKIKKINMIVNEKNLEKYQYRVNLKNKEGKNLLFYESNSGQDKWFVDYNRDLKYIIEKFKDNYNIYIKPHPRRGYSKILEDYNVTILEDYIPSELLVLENFDIILGLESTSIVTRDFKNTFCLINLFEYSDLERKKYIVNYLNVLSQEKIILPESVDDIFFQLKKDTKRILLRKERDNK